MSADETDAQRIPIPVTKHWPLKTTDYPPSNWAIPMYLPNGDVSARISMDYVHILENGKLRAERHHLSAAQDSVSFESRRVEGGVLFIVSVRKPDDEFPTPILTWTKLDVVEVPERQITWQAIGFAALLIVILIVALTVGYTLTMAWP